MTSRERLLTVMQGGRADHTPLAFMLFHAVRAARDDWFGRIEAQIEMSLDVVADLTSLVPCSAIGHDDAHGIPLAFPADVKLRQWKETPADSRYPVLHKEYETPCGTLSVAVNQTDDWLAGDAVPFLDDYLAPRCTKYLVTCEEDLPALRHLLCDPTPESANTCREAWNKGKEFAEQHNILLANGWGIGSDSLAWFTGLQHAMLFAIDQPEFFDALLDVISDWNRKRMELMLESGIDLFIRRAWYEGTAFWSPSLFRRFFLPRLKSEVEMAHQAGALFGYIFTEGSLQFADVLLESGIDVLIGIDPVEDAGMDMAALKARLGKKMCLWGGVNSFVTVERGAEDEIREAVRTAMDALGPDAFILSPVDNIRDQSDEVWRNTMVMVDAWKQAME